MQVTSITLSGQHASLEPLKMTHVADLAVAAESVQHIWYTVIPNAADMPTEIERRLGLQNAGSMLPFAVMVGGKAMGMTTYMNIDAKNQRLEIGSTWLSKSVQRSFVNTECKLMLLTHAFETLKVIAVEFRTHFMNQQSRAAIARLGAKQDGILRNHQIMRDGSLRDTVVFSIIASEWPAVKNNLLHKLGRI